MNQLALAATLLLLLTAPAFAQGRGERPETFVNVATVAPALIVEARYAGSHNFVGDQIDGYEKPICYLTRTAAAALAQVVADLKSRRLTLKAFDCYRPERAVAHFVRWARNVGDVKTKAEFYPQVDKSTLFADGYIAARSGHSRGSTVDLTLARRSNGPGVTDGYAIRFLQSALMAVRPERERGGSAQSRLVGAGHAKSRLPRLQQGMVALHAASRTLPGNLFQFSGPVAASRLAAQTESPAAMAGLPGGHEPPSKSIVSRRAVTIHDRRCGSNRPQKRGGHFCPPKTAGD